jgi:hypothetical protein
MTNVIFNSGLNSFLNGLLLFQSALKSRRIVTLYRSLAEKGLFFRLLPVLRKKAGSSTDLVADQT